MIQYPDYILVPKAWRSESLLLGVFLISLVASVVLSNLLPRSIIEGEVFAFHDTQVILKLPLFWLVPCFVLSQAAWRVYNVRYTLDARGLESIDGRLSLYQTTVRVRFEDIRTVETKQSLLDRCLDIGIVEVGTAATGDLELIMHGVSEPRKVREFIQTERDRRLKGMGSGFSSTSPEAAAPIENPSPESTRNGSAAA